MFETIKHKVQLHNPRTLQISEHTLGLLFGEMVTNLRIIPGDCCIGGVRHILSSLSVLVTNSPTSIRSRLPSSTPFPSQRPHGNLPNSLSVSNGSKGIIWKMWQNPLSSLVSVSCYPIADHHRLNQPLSVQSRVIMTHLNGGQLAQVLTLC